MRTQISLLLAVVALAATTLSAQTPAPVVVQAVGPAAAPVAQPGAPAAAGASGQAALQLLNSMKAANAEILKKQEATLVQLDELQKAAEQLKIYSKRG